jgi:hypothetical protein
MQGWENLEAANALLSASSLAGLRLFSWTASDGVVRFQVFHVEWEGIVFGELVFLGVAYVQAPDRTSWGYGIRLAPHADLPGRRDIDTGEIVYELYAADGAEPSAFVVAQSLEVRVAAHER